MGDFLFVVKSLVVTVMIVMIMQIRVGPSTLEQHSVTWMHESSAVESLRAVSAGAVKAVEQGVRYVGSFFDTHTSKVLNRNKPGSRLQGLGFRRSESVERDLERKQRPHVEAEEPDQTEKVDNVDES